MASSGVSSNKGWMRCGFGSCSKQIEMERELRLREKIDKSGLRRPRFRSKSKDPDPWEREDDWSVLAQGENDRGNEKLVLKTKKGQKKSSKLAASPSIFPSEAVLAATPDIKCSLRDAYEEVREAAKYDMPAQRSDHYRAAAVDCSSKDSRGMVIVADDECTKGEERGHAWERSVSSLSSDDDELFTTSFELDGQSNKARRKKWSSNSSDDTEGRQRRIPRSHIRSKSTWSTHSIQSVQEEDDIVENFKTKGKKGSRIIFLSTPPRPQQLGINEDKPSAEKDQLVLKSSSDRFGEYSKIDPAEKESRFDRAFSIGYKSSASQEADLEANAKAWAKLDLRAIRGDDYFSDGGVRELPIVSSRPKAHLRRIDVRIEDQLVNLRLESDASDSSQGKTYCGSRGSRRYTKGISKFLDQEKPSPKKKRGTHSRRRRGRRTRAPPPPLPGDLHGKVKESVAVVKSSYDPYSDFRDSMVEMIVEKEIQGAADLEELLRCYLSLNSAEYHSVIVKVFADVWRELFADAI